MNEDESSMILSQTPNSKPNTLSAPDSKTLYRTMFLYSQHKTSEVLRTFTHTPSSRRLGFQTLMGVSENRGP